MKLCAIFGHKWSKWEYSTGIAHRWCRRCRKIDPPQAIEKHERLAELLAAEAVKQQGSVN